MSAIDILIIIVFLGSIIYGFCRGIIVQIGAVGGIILGIVLCRLFGHSLTTTFAGSGASEEQLYISGVFANVLLFLIGYVSARLVAGLIKTITTKLRLTVIDRIGGALFSLFEWFFIFSLLLNVWQALKPGIEVTQGSRIGNGRAVKAVIDFAPMVIGSDTAKTLWDALPETQK